jgi:hypothetical protein
VVSNTTGRRGSLFDRLIKGMCDMELRSRVYVSVVVNREQYVCQVALGTAGRASRVRYGDDNKRTHRVAYRPVTKKTIKL